MVMFMLTAMSVLLRTMAESYRSGCIGASSLGYVRRTQAMALYCQCVRCNSCTSLNEIANFDASTLSGPGTKDLVFQIIITLKMQDRFSGIEG